MKERFLAILFSVLLVLVVVACGTNDVPPPEEPATEVPVEEPVPEEPVAEPPTEVDGEINLADIQIGVTLVNIVEPFFADIRDSLEEEAAAYGIGRIDIQDGRNDPSRQLSQVEDFIAQGFDLIIINPVEAEALVSAAEAANRAGIPVFTIDRKLDTTYGSDGVVLTHLGASAVDGGIYGMQIVANKLEEIHGSPQGTVIYLEGTPGSSVARDRTEGVMQTLANFPDIEIIAQQPGESLEAGMEVTENLLQLHPDVDAIYSFSGDGALGALQALQNIGNTTTFVVGTGGESIQFNEIHSGSQLIGTVDFSGRGTGRDAIVTAIYVLNGGTVGEWVVSQATMVTIDNVAQFLD
jgi:ribose transport system substrate-binding protein